jgi:hypothetical protein
MAVLEVDPAVFNPNLTVAAFRPIKDAMMTVLRGDLCAIPGAA